MKKQNVLVICPGRGSYNAEELGYLNKFKPDINPFLSIIDNERSKLSEKTISELDGAEKFQRQIHTKGEHASALIYACAMADFMAIDREKYNIVAVAGNSMGWYISLGVAGAMDSLNSFKLVNTMGSMMKGGNVGGQIIYPICNEQWQIDSDKLSLVKSILEKLNKQAENEIHISIYLGGNILLGANEAGLKALLKELPPITLGKIEYPFQLMNHAAFHTPILTEVSQKAFTLLGLEMFNKPKVPMIDGRGKIWSPYSTDINELRNYTLEHQVIAPYDFTTSISVALKEFSPDKLILLGPGSSLGGSIAQILIKNKWNGITSKDSFMSQQRTDPFLLSVGREDQRNLVLSPKYK